MAQIFDEAQHIKDSFSTEQIKEMWSSAIPNNMAQQTAVEWFAQWVNYHKLNQSLTLETLDDLTVKAKQMEKEQEWELKAFWFGRGILAARENKISELKPTKSE